MEKSVISSIAIAVFLCSIPLNVFLKTAELKPANAILNNGVTLQSPEDSILRNIIAYGTEQIKGKWGYGYRTATAPNSVNIGNTMWVVPADMKVSDQQIDEEVGDWFGGNLSFWKYSSPQMTYDVYYSTIKRRPFPVTSKGLQLDIEELFSNVAKPEDIYMVCDSTILHYDKDKLPKAGWEEHGDGHFTFNIPQNTSGQERYWRVMMYYQDTEIYVKIENHREFIVEADSPKHVLRTPKSRRPCAILNFIQPIDSTYIPRLFDADFSAYDSLLPSGNKPWPQ